ncbi:hypothetical protein F4802DRAFT_9127 [Xylaria palmicola]|nr:hypothetical protein F4802DRAFT_9127 [Xylaria palmicola]
MPPSGSGALSCLSWSRVAASSCHALPALAGEMRERARARAGFWGCVRARPKRNAPMPLRRLSLWSLVRVCLVRMGESSISPARSPHAGERERRHRRRPKPACLPPLVQLHRRALPTNPSFAVINPALVASSLSALVRGQREKPVVPTVEGIVLVDRPDTNWWRLISRLDEM